MSQDKINDEQFDLWLSTNLKGAPAANPAFVQKVVHRMEYLAAQKMLRKVIFEKRIAGGMLILSIATVIGLLCCAPVLRRIYVLLESAFTGLIGSFIDTQTLVWPILAAGLFVLCLLVKSLWKNLMSDY